MSEKRQVYFTVTPAEDSNVEYAQESNQEMNKSEVDLERYLQTMSTILMSINDIYIGIYIYLFIHIYVFILDRIYRAPQ